MHHNTSPIQSRFGITAAYVAVFAVTTASVAGVCWAGITSWPAVQSGNATLDELAAFISACAAAIVAAWAVVAAIAIGLARLPGAVGKLGQALTARVVPVVARHALPALFGATAIAAPAAAVAAAAPLATPVASISTAQPNPEGRVEGIDRPAAARAWLEANEHAGFDAPAPPEPDERLSRLPPSPQYVAVRGGDSLWSIAAKHLGPNTTTADIASEWPRWFAANRDEIGPDPDLIQVGTLLAIPAHR